MFVSIDPIEDIIMDNPQLRIDPASIVNHHAEPNHRENQSPASTKAAPTQDKKLRPKTMVFESNRYYLHDENDRGTVWHCSTSRFTNCTGRLRIDSTGKKIRASGAHDHASNI